MYQETEEISTAEENEPLSNGSETGSDCEKGVTGTRGGRQNKNADDDAVRSLCTEPCHEILITALWANSVTPVPRRPRRSICVQYESDNNRPPGLTQTDVSPGTPNPGYIHTTKLRSASPLPAVIRFSTTLCTVGVHASRSSTGTTADYNCAD